MGTLDDSTLKEDKLEFPIYEFNESRVLLLCKDFGILYSRLHSFIQIGLFYFGLFLCFYMCQVLPDTGNRKQITCRWYDRGLQSVSRQY